MESSSRDDTLSKLFEQIIEWRRGEYMILDEVKFHWNEIHLSVVHSYVLKFGHSSDFRVLRYAKLSDETPSYSVEYAKIVAFFTQELREFFSVPSPHQWFNMDNTLKKKELMAAFIDFLLQLLYHKTDLFDPFKDRIDSLQKELRFLLTVLGDTLLLCDEHEQVQNLLAKFEAVADEAGSLVHSFFFKLDRVLETMDEGLGIILKHMGVLKNSIIKFLNLLPFISRSYITPTTSVVDSHFIVVSLLYDLEDLMNQEDTLITDVKDQIKMFHQWLIFLQSSIKEIGAPEPSEIGELKEPLMQIGDLAYEAQYLINSFLVGDIPSWYLIIRLRDFINKIELIETGVKELKKNYGITAPEIAKDFTAQLSFQEKTISEVDDIIVGLEDTSINIMDNLDKLVGGSEQLQVISIVGMPGLGKTTMAKKLYNHSLVSYKFDKRSWCIISQTYQRKSILIDILNSLSELHKVRNLNKDEESLVEHIHKSLKGRRYLIVMDDIWSSKLWYDLRRCFPDDGNGSRILFTSRNKDVAPPNSIIYELPPLSNDQCWELLKKKVFQNQPCPGNLLKIGKKIAANCCGLPLAVVVIAGILSTMETAKSTWEKVGGNLASYIFEDNGNSVMEILELSYKHLPEHLKLCFLYFGAFPEDKEIPARKLMRLWIAEGFIHKEQRKNSESVAEEYLMELIDKSLVIVAERRSDGGVKACVIHDLLRDLCLRRSKEENFLQLANNNYPAYEKGHCLVSLQHSIIPSGQRVRSFHGDLLNSPFYVGNMKLLRVLDFKAMKNSAYLIGIEYLVQLRYLVINHFPVSMGSLVNLEYLVVNSSVLYTEIPCVILKMVKLRYLQVSGLAIFDEGCNTSQRNNLEFLSDVIIDKLNDEEMLKCSPHLRKLKCRCEPLLEENGEYRYPDIRFLTQLESLRIHFYGRKMEEINFPSSIKKLTLSDLCLPWEKMWIIGRLSNLEVLKLEFEDSESEGKRWDTSDGEFQQLRCLKLYLVKLVQWNVTSSEHFPKLQRLVLRHCSYLQEIPCEIGEIAMMQLIEVQGLSPKSLVESAIQIQQEQRDIGNEELRVIIRNTKYMSDAIPQDPTWQL